MDPKAFFREVSDLLTPLVEGTDSAHLANDTPCDGFTVRDLIGHLVGVSHRDGFRSEEGAGHGNRGLGLDDYGWSPRRGAGLRPYRQSPLET